ncbi:MAG: MBL fold metallo-hydrolase [Candidatus Nezhaarchaeota archaeon]|nr:MBL fold metallo-hydrolase [Candidatus Nezhaarchaeota archaeon]
MLKIEAADSLEVVVLVDNYIDVLLRDEGPARRWGMASSLTSPRQPIAEHGLSLLVKARGGGVERQVLMDGGFTDHGVVHNMEALGVSPHLIDAVFLSHGHLDHYGGLRELLKKVGRRVPVYVHPEAFYTRLFTLPSGLTLGPWRLSQADIEEAGGVVVTARNSLPLAPGLATTGEVERVTDFEGGMEVARRIRDGLYEADPVLDDQALVACVKDLGLVVIAGCAHSGIVNTVRHASRLMGREAHAVIGGFHLSGASDEVLSRTIQELKKAGVKVVVPMHCTGFKAAARIAQEFKEGFVVSSVGTRLKF